MLRNLELTIGKSYVREETQTAFEVMELRNSTVKYKSYDLASGELYGSHLECHKSDFIRMVDRAATHAEMAGFQTSAVAETHRPDQKPKLNPRLEELKHMRNVNIAR